jgi:hypothetical protein
MKFKYDYLNNQLWRLDGEYAYQLSEDSQFRTNDSAYGGDGFLLDGDNHWIIFTFYPEKIRVFYKQPNKNGEITYYRQDISLTRELTTDELERTTYPGKIEFEFTEKDIIIKDAKGFWTKQWN